jgi:hypothetical protein
MEEGVSLRSTYGDLRAVRVRSSGDAVRTFVYPRSAGDPPGEDVRKSFAVTADGFRSVLGSVAGTMYAGRSAAGGVGREVEGVSLDACGFVAQIRGGRVVAIEADRDVAGRVQGRRVRLRAHTPLEIR